VYLCVRERVREEQTKKIERKINVEEEYGGVRQMAVTYIAGGIAYV
jgi:hypothetical protein